MRLLSVLCVLAVGCASTAEMRPRGRRNAVRIDALEKKIASMEVQLQELAATNRSLTSLIQAMNRPRAVEQAPAPAPAPAPGP